MNTTPPESRFEREVLPVAPLGEADCSGMPCLSDRQMGLLVNDLIDVVCAANDKLAWLSDYYIGTSLEASCPTKVAE